MHSQKGCVVRIDTLRAQNYRTLQEIQLLFAKNYCTLSGRNNAGKSSVIRLLSALFRASVAYPWRPDQLRLDYKDDKTQWVKASVPINIEYALTLTKEEDPALIAFIERIASKTIAEPSASLRVVYTVTESEGASVAVWIDGAATDEKAAKEIEKRIKDSNLLFLYNSTTPHDEYYYGSRRRMLYDFVMSEEEQKALYDAERHVERRLRRLAKEHTQGLSNILGRLSDRFEVEVTPPESYTARSTPLGLSLKDRHVEVPLSDWGSGTQNRTQILMAILQASRIKRTESATDRITPFVVVEEPESFLHPSAQAEFGRVLRHLSSELGIQIIATTHSPYMLNQEEPTSNLLLGRRVKRKKAFESFVVNTSGDGWMAPFSEHLGLPADEFARWKDIFTSQKSKVLLVEGPLDQEYFTTLSGEGFACERLSADIEIAPYGGKDTLKNTLLVQFVLRKFDHVFVTYDLDADAEIRSALHRLGLREGRDFIALGRQDAGKDCMEGLLPERVLAAVNGRETDLVMKLGSRDNAERRRAKEALKKKYLEEFTSRKDHSKDELRELSRIIKAINSRFADRKPVTIASHESGGAA
jgi:putative ATP-dependent endonuclease of the OLD family